MINSVVKMLIQAPGRCFLSDKLCIVSLQRCGFVDSILGGDSSVFCSKITNYDNIVQYNESVAVNPLFIEKVFKGNYLGSKVISYVETDSTNDIAWGNCTDRSNSGLIVLADSQRAGRGRFSDRKWFDTPNNSVLMSVLIHSDYVQPDTLSVGAAVAAVEAIYELCGLEVKIKWPNDIMYGNKKIAGMMVESRVVNGERWYVLGIGFNCNQSIDELAEEVVDKASSIFIETGKFVDRDAMVLFFLEKLDQLLTPEIGRDHISARWMGHCCAVNSTISLMHHGEVFEGVVEELDPFGGLWLMLIDGSRKFFDARTCSIISF